MIIGVCGKIASGKSEIMKILRTHGFHCIDADQIVHDLYRPNGEGSKRIAAVFGEKFLKQDGSVDRKKLSAVVFDDENKLKLLNNVIHPVVFAEIASLIEEDRWRNIAIEAVYFDVGLLGDFVQKIIWIRRSKEAICHSLIEDRGFEAEMVEKMYLLTSEPAKVDFTVNNDSDLKNLEKQIEKILSTC